MKILVVFYYYYYYFFFKEIAELKAELERKEKMLEKHHDKLPKWQALLRLRDPTPTTTPSSPYSGSQGPPHQSMAPVPPSAGPQIGVPPQVAMMGGTMPPGQYPGPPAGHPGQYMPPPAYPQGPLAYLERM